MVIVLPVCGFRPGRAGRAVTEKVPKPTSRTLSPAFMAAVIAANTASMAR